VPGARVGAAPGTIARVEQVEPVDPVEGEAAELAELAEQVEPAEHALVEPVASVVIPEAASAPAPAEDDARVAPTGHRDRLPQVPRSVAPGSMARPAADGPRAAGEGGDAAVERAATAPQLRRFIKSRAYVPMHELRRRFGINGADDEVTPVDLERRRVFVGLPEREGRLLGELLRAGDIGYELSLDPISPIVVGVYPMRPVTRA
jgi:hypothetical protein